MHLSHRRLVPTLFLLRLIIMIMHPSQPILAPHAYTFASALDTLCKTLAVLFNTPTFGAGAALEQSHVVEGVESVGTVLVVLAELAPAHD